MNFSKISRRDSALERSDKKNRMKSSNPVFNMHTKTK